MINLTTDEMEAIVDLIEVAVPKLKMSRGLQNTLMSAGYKLRLQHKLISWKESQHGKAQQKHCVQ